MDITLKNKKGVESINHYPNCVIEFLNIPNIHVMRESLNKLNECIASPVFQDQEKWMSAVEVTGWLSKVCLILNAGVKIARIISQGNCVVIHCSDGWDRTAQLSSLGMILLDPYFRTIEGFQILIEKEW